MWIEKFKKKIKGRDLQCVKKSKVYIYIMKRKNEDDDGDRNRKRSATETSVAETSAFFFFLFTFFFFRERRIIKKKNNQIKHRNGKRFGMNDTNVITIIIVRQVKVFG